VEPGLDVGGGIRLRSPVGVGTNKWGVDASKYDADSLSECYRAAIAGGMTLFNTAQLYNGGESEQCLGRLRAAEGPRPEGVIVSKFASLRCGPEGLVASLRESLRRCQMETLDAFLVHHPRGDQRVLADQLAQAVREGLCRTVGVSNFGEAELRRFHSLLAERGVPLLFNEVEFSLLRRAPETNGLIAACRELGVTVLAWAPLASGRLTGKHTELGSPQTLELVQALRAIGERRGRSSSSVAINWCVCKGTVPIPGARTREQAEENSRGAGWRLTAEEVQLLDGLASEDHGMYSSPEALYAFLGWWPRPWLRPLVSVGLRAGMSIAKVALPVQRDMA